ncbi:MAG: hypothetical protein ACI9LG_001012 [Moritella dasanensis]|jgi:hypothetical protein
MLRTTEFSAMNIDKYNYSHAKSFIQDPNCHYKMSNFKGEVYEASFFEMLIAEAVGKSQDYKLVAKGPYASNRKCFIDTGFYCDLGGKLIYNSNSITIAEFDAIKLNDKSLLFFECTVTQNSGLLRTLKKEVSRKITLLHKLFPDKCVNCTIVSDNDLTLNKFSNCEDINTLHYTPPEVDLLELAKTYSPEKTTTFGETVSAKYLNKIMVKYDYLTEFQNVSTTLFSKKTLSSVKDAVLSSNGLFQRLYWGKMDKAFFPYDVDTIDAEQIIISINFSNIKRPTLRYYFIENKSKAPFEAKDIPKKLNKRKSSRTELLRICNKLPKRQVHELKELKDELIQWQNMAVS